MSIRSEWLRPLVRLLFPERCAVCGGPLSAGEEQICTLCRVTAPFTRYAAEPLNPVLRRCTELLPVTQASAFLFFRQGSGWQRLIHGFKYRGRWRTARLLGEWYGRELRQSGLYADVDAVVPLPLHPFKRIRRGYNQSEFIAEGIAAQLGVPLDRTSVFRSRNTAEQALRTHRERAANVAGAFSVRHPERLAGRHLLLVDDVMTTGSTLLTCAEAMLQAAPDCRISIAALAVVRHGIGVKE